MRKLKTILCLALAMMLIASSIPAFALETATAKAKVKKPMINIEGPADIFTTTSENGGNIWMGAYGEFDSYGKPATLYVDVFKGTKRVFRYKESLSVSEDDVGEWEFYDSFTNSKDKSVIKPKTKYKVKIYIKSGKVSSKVISFSFKAPKKWW